jgi:uncharacterized protein (TIGR02145 family)
MKNKLFKITLAATLGFAIILTLSCSGGNPDDNGGGGGNGNGGGGGGGTAAGGSGGSCDIGDYTTVTIGEQVWMAENWNCNIDGSVCHDNEPANCATYGRLYSWATAMVLPDSCNSSWWCASQIGEKHQGICPSGWHIPSNAERFTLTNYVGGVSTAGTKLKATSGWNDYDGKSGNGTDAYGFAALPGSGVFFLSHHVGYEGFWWLSTEGSAYGAYYWGLSYRYDDYQYGSNSDKGDKLSVRCVQD